MADGFVQTERTRSGGDEFVADCRICGAARTGAGAAAANGACGGAQGFEVRVALAEYFAGFLEDGEQQRAPVLLLGLVGGEKGVGGIGQAAEEGVFGARTAGEPAVVAQGEEKPGERAGVAGEDAEVAAERGVAVGEREGIVGGEDAGGVPELGGGGVGGVFEDGAGADLSGEGDEERMAEGGEVHALTLPQGIGHRLGEGVRPRKISAWLRGGRGRGREPLVRRGLSTHHPRRMPTRKQSWRIEAAQQGIRLDRFLLKTLPEAWGREVTRAQVDRLIGSGGVDCDGRRERLGSRLLRAGLCVTVAADAAAPAAGPRPETLRTYTWAPERILFEDEWLIVVDKPAGLPTQPTLDAKRASVFGTLQGFLAQRDGRETYLGLHHRLDRDTSGVVLFTKDRRANAATAALFSGKTAQKTYLALAVAGPDCAEAWRVENYLGVVGRVGKAEKFGAVRSGGDPAQTSFRVIERPAGALLVEAQPHTGRTHQIRVHLAEGGHPICGDALYGGPLQLRAPNGCPVAVPRTMLHAARLEFPHPVTGATVVVASPMPADMAECLTALR